MKIERALKNPNIYQLRWNEPHPALNSAGGKVDAHVMLTASVADCINMSRCSAAQSTVFVGASDRDLLLDFIAVHWAVVVLDRTGGRLL